MSEEKVPASGPAQSTPARFFYLSEFAERDLAFYHRALVSDRRSIDATPQSWLYDCWEPTSGNVCHCARPCPFVPEPACGASRSLENEAACASKPDHGPLDWERKQLSRLVSEAVFAKDRRSPSFESSQEATFQVRVRAG